MEQQLTFRDRVCGVRLGFTWMGLQRRVEGEAKEEVNELLGSDGKAISLGKKILDNKNEYVRNLTRLKNEASLMYRNSTLPYVEKGTRLLARERFMGLRDLMGSFREQIKTAEAELELHREEVIGEARAKLGPKLFLPSDYPANFLGLFDLTFEPVNLEPPSYLMELSPEDYQKALKRLDEGILESFQVAERQLGEQLHKLVDHLVERLRPDDDGNKKRLNATSIDNLFEFFSRFNDLRAQMSGARDMSELGSVVQKCREAIGDYDADALRFSQKVRDKVASSFGVIREELEARVVTSGKRKVIPKKAEEGVENVPSEG